ncbi:GntR family transcriptional regulator [Streptomyces sp. NBC_01497]|uniref:GntR family transcriptional regulator n=1 Tax=Streptomyces sp. NBC_01497 TaxID=2903885 RepID=UPI002E33EEFB|nr:GntR family transcriptional regulator [Streptomyces sp. NBC_01497]
MANRYQSIADDLRRLIETGKWLPGHRLPSELDLATRYSVSTPTLRNALEVLQVEGLVEKRHGSGNFVRQPQDRVRYAIGECGVERQASSGEGTEVSSERSVVAADSRTASVLEVPTGSALTEYVFTSRRLGSLRSLARVYVPHSVAVLGEAGASGSPWGGAVRDMLAAAGVQVMATVERVVSRFATSNEAQLLHIATRTPVLAVERLSTDANGQVVELALLVLPGDRAEVLLTTRCAHEGEVAAR